MAVLGKLTNNSEESDVSGLLSGDSIFAVPYFQRPYKWKKPRLDQFEADLLALVDDESLTHFLGAVIIHGRRSSPSDPTLYEVIDGQQRITTIYLYLSAGLLGRTTTLSRVLLEAGHSTAPVSLHSLFANMMSLPGALPGLLFGDQPVEFRDPLALRRVLGEALEAAAGPPRLALVPELLEIEVGH
jgi:hypothetical protein